VSGWDVAQVLFVLGAGGVIGATAGLAMAARSAQEAVDRFGQILRDFAVASSDPKAPELIGAYEDVKLAFKGTLAAVLRLKQALRMK
jgi:hypothetical protein